MLPFLLHWYLVFSVIWDVQPREAFVKNNVRSYIVWAGGNSTPKRERTVMLNKQGDIVAVYKHIDATTIIRDTFIYEYFPDNRVKKVTKDNGTYLYEYTLNGQVNKMEHFGLAGSLERTTEYTYDNLGRLKEERSQFTDEKEPYLVAAFSTDSLSKSIVETENATGKWFGTSVYYFDKEGRISRMEREVKGSRGRLSYTYEYNDKGLVATETIDAPGKKTEVKRYDYTYWE